MTYEKTIDFIHSLPRFDNRKDLQRVEDFLSRLASPHRQLKFVHVIGTNGKGSTCTMLSYILKNAGYRVGLYVSPFVVDFRERMQVDNELIAKDQLVRLSQQVEDVWRQMKEEGQAPLELEFVLAVALLYFVEEQCDIVILESGIGGTRDATNVIPPALATVFTSISLDHTHLLGDSLTAIATDKAGAIKAGTDVVVYPHQAPEVLAVLMERCAKTATTLHMPHQVEQQESHLLGNHFVYDSQRYHISLGGQHQIYNAVTALETCNVLQTKGFPTPESARKTGLEQAFIPSRLEVLSRQPLVVLDGAHNEGGAAMLAHTLASLGPDARIHGVVGMVEGKDYHRVLELVAPYLVSAAATQAWDSQRFLAPALLAQDLAAYVADVIHEDNPLTALQSQWERTKPGDVLVIFGSFYLAGDLRAPAMKLIEERD